MQKISSTYFIPREGDGFHELFKRVRIMPLYSFPHIKDFNVHISEHQNRYFAHIDFDAFFAQVEQRDNLRLRGKPVSVGSMGEGNKGIVMTASYEARAMGVETGMTVVEAKKFCPELISLPCYGPKYEAIMQNLLDSLKSFVPEECIEKYSIDECFIDMSPVAKNFKDAERIGRVIKKLIRDDENLTISMGISYNKTFAKLATKLQKPDGLTVITKINKQKIYSMPANKLWGIGRRIEKRLNVLGIKTIGELAASTDRMMKKEFGINGWIFRRLALGEDTSGIIKKLKPEKSLNHFHSLSESIFEPHDVRKEIRRMGEYICRKLREKNLVAGCMHFSIRFDDLTYTSAMVKLTDYTNDDRKIFDAAIQIFAGLRKPSKDLQGRQFGIGVFDLHTDTLGVNLNLFRNEVRLPFRVLDNIKSKFGEGIIRIGLES